LAKELIGELQRLKGERDEETGNVRVTHREGDHDDLGIVLAAANWWANKETKGNHALRLVR
jgi:hypothetical protein